MLTKSDKQTQFDLYWQTRDLDKADLRSQQRSEIVYSLLTQKKGRLLDVGCGRGWNAAFFKKQGFQVAAVDISPDAVELTRQRSIPAKVLDLEQEEVEGEYDVILCLEVLQFVLNPLKVLIKLEQALPDKGELILSLPNEFHLFNRVKTLLGRPDWGGYQAPHIRFFYPAEIRGLVQASGFQIKAIHPVSIIPPSYRYFSKLGDLLARLFPGLFALSLIVKAAKKQHDKNLP